MSNSKHAISLLFVCLTACMPASAACKYTPLTWQNTIREHSDSRFLGQEKHIGWIRDLNANFIDDQIEQNYGPGQVVNVIVDLNRCSTPSEIQERFQRYGQIQYIGKLVTYVLLGSVRFDDLTKLAAEPSVAMVELQTSIKTMDDVSSRAVQSRLSNTYSPNTAQSSGFNGSGVVVAIIDSGVDQTHEAFQGRIGPGFNALDPSDPGDGSSKPPDNFGHGTHVAGIALGIAPVARTTCRIPNDGTTPTYCEGVKVCDQNGNCSGAATASGLDWVGIHREEFNIRVANISLGDCIPDDGTSAFSEEVNYLVAQGIAVAVADGNAANCRVSPGTTLQDSPASASYAITVGGTYDGGTITRTDDTIFFSYLTGPRSDFSLANPNLAALKPDISAPGQNIYSAQAGVPTGYVAMSGTSMASPHVAGALAVLMQARPDINPGNAKALLMQEADTTKNVAQFPTADPNWDKSFGEGMLNVDKAIAAATTVDVKFPSCIAGPAVRGGPCVLGGGLPPWDNRVDINTASPPRVGVPNAITARVQNTGGVAVTVLVRFGIYQFAAGNNVFYDVGTQQVTLPANTTQLVTQPWTPVAANHQCAQVVIDFPFDTNYTNNVTQRNLAVSASEFEFRVENPYMLTADFEVKLSAPTNWKCTATPMKFTIDPFKDCPQTVKVTFKAPPGVADDEPRSCDVAVFATKHGTTTQEAIGGVTVDTLRPQACSIGGRLLSRSNSPLSLTDLEFTPVEGGPTVKIKTDASGNYSISLPKFTVYDVIAKQVGGADIKGSFQTICGPMNLKVVGGIGGPELIAQ
jgi:subtilisin family serine protease